MMLHGSLTSNLQKTIDSRLIGQYAVFQFERRYRISRDFSYLPPAHLLSRPFVHPTAAAAVASKMFMRERMEMDGRLG